MSSKTHEPEMLTLPQRLRMKADCITMGERIEFGSECLIMHEAAEEIEHLKRLVYARTQPSALPQRPALTIATDFIQPDSGGIEWSITAVELENQYGSNKCMLIDDYRALLAAMKMEAPERESLSATANEGGERWHTA